MKKDIEKLVGVNRVMKLIENGDGKVRWKGKKEGGNFEKIISM